MSDSEDDLAERVAELEAAVEDLRDELRPPRGPLGLPRPPRPGEVLKFTDEYAIPAAIAVLEANVRVLELLQGILRAGRTADAASSSARERAADLGRESLARLDRALEELNDAMEEGSLPREPESRRLLEDVRELNRQVRKELSAGEESTDNEVTTDGDTIEDEGVEVDVESELQSIKDEVNAEENPRENEGEAESEDGETDDDGEDGSD